MREIQDSGKLESFWQEQRVHFSQRPPVIKLVEFEKGELLHSPLYSLCQFYIIVNGHVSIYTLNEGGEIRYISQVGCGSLLGDMEFSGADKQALYAEAESAVLCLLLPFRENQSALEQDPVFLRFVLSQLAKKLSFSTVLDISAQTLEEKLLFLLRNLQLDHEISSVNHALQLLHCSRRQLQRVLKKLCDEGLLRKTGRGHYRLNE